MNTKLNNVEINPEYAGLFSYKTIEEKIEHNAHMISYRILSEVEKICDIKKIKKKDLAELVGTSRSYITQLFRGNKQVNTDIMAKFEEALQMSFEVKGKLNAESREQFVSNWLNKESVCYKKFYTKGHTWYGLPDAQEKEATSTLVSKMDKEEKQINKTHKSSKMAV
jgi:transcriptional regulator with XRE-family HTH domain